jgi:predicted DNA-binding transcriptional regulator YafY
MTRKKTSGRRRQYRKPNYNSAIRIASLVDHLPRHDLGMRLSSVAEYLGVSEQTVRRYVKALDDEFRTDDGEPQFFIETRGQEKWLCRRERFSEPADAHIYQLVSVYLSFEIFKMLGPHLSMVDMVDQVYATVEKALTVGHRQRIKDLPRKFFNAPWAPKDYSESDELISDVMKAVVYQFVVEMIYKPSNGQPEPHRVKPLTLLYHKGGLYLIGDSNRHKKPVYFALERIQGLSVTRDKFVYPENYDPAKMLDGAFGIFSGPARTFKLKFPPALNEYIRSRQWHRSQKFERQDDGSLVMTLKVTDSEEVRAWIRSFGEKVNVLE